MYLTYDKYLELGGSISEPVFTRFEVKAERKLDYYTQGRIKKLDSIPQCVMDVMFEFITFFAEHENDLKDVTSYSNGVESFGFDTSKDSNSDLYRLAIEILPINLISAQLD